jgi:hypothetical protein
MRASRRARSLSTSAAAVVGDGMVVGGEELGVHSHSNASRPKAVIKAARAGRQEKITSCDMIIRRAETGSHAYSSSRSYYTCWRLLSRLYPPASCSSVLDAAQVLKPSQAAH